MGWRQGQLVAGARRTAGAAALAVLLGAWPHIGLAHSAGVVFQISARSPVTWKVAVHNVHNLEQALKPHEPHIEIVVFGPAIPMLARQSPVAPALRALHRSGVTIATCARGAHRRGFTAATLLPFVHFIPSGIAEIVRLERAGWAYVRP